MLLANVSAHVLIAQTISSSSIFYYFLPEKEIKVKLQLYLSSTLKFDTVINAIQLVSLQLQEMNHWWLMVIMKS